MKKSLLTLGVLAVSGYGITGCGSSSASTVNVSGFTIDIDLLGGNNAMHPEWATDPTGGQKAVAASCVPNTPVYAFYADGTKTDTVIADASCNYSLSVKSGSTIHLVAAAQGQVLNTYSNEETMVGTTDVTGVPAHVCTANQYSAPVGVAKAANMAIDQFTDQGACMFGTLNKVAAPFQGLVANSIAVAPADFDVYGWTDPTTSPPTYVKQSSTPIGIEGITKTGLTTDTTVTIAATDASTNGYTYPSTTCLVKPGFISFMPLSPNR